MNIVCLQSFFYGILFNKLYCFSTKMDEGRMKVEIGRMKRMRIVEVEY